MEKKKCTKCNKVKLLSKFFKNGSKKNGYNYWCKKCVFEYNQSEERKEMHRRYQKKYQNNQSEERKEECKKKNREYQKKYHRKYYQRNKEKILKGIRKYRQSKGSKEQRRNYHRKYRQNNINAYIADNLRSRIGSALKGITKSASTIELLGCSIEKFLIHLESRFQSGMTWKNYGSYWEIHHIIPCSAFDLSDPKQQKKCFHYTNLQPLYWKDNLSKGNKY